MPDLVDPLSWTKEQRAEALRNLRLRTPTGPPVVTIFVRHSPDCKYKGDEFCKRCNCRKHFRWSSGGRQHRRKAGTRSWAEAEDAKRKLDDQLAGRIPKPSPDDTAQTIRAAISAFEKEKEVQGVIKQTRRVYHVELNRFATFCENSGVFTLHGVTASLITLFKSTWPGYYKSSYTRHVAQRRLHAFLKYCADSEWLTRVPKMAPVKIEEPPTMPLTEAEYQKLLEAVPGEFTNGTAARVRSVIALMRWSGLAVRDASCLRRDALSKHEGHYSVMTNRQKTGTDVYVPIPPNVGDEILAAALPEGEYLFWTPRKSQQITFASHKGTEISRCFTRAGIQGQNAMVSHRLRDTFACDLLSKGVSLADVSKMLGHRSIVTTERSYAKWVRARQDRLNQIVSGTWKK